MATLRFCYASPAASHGAGGRFTLTIIADHSVGAGHKGARYAIPKNPERYQGTGPRERPHAGFGNAGQPQAQRHGADEIAWGLETMLTENDGCIVDPQWLEERLGDASLKIFDCTVIGNSRQKHTGLTDHYERNHIPGAAYLDIGDPRGRLSNPAGEYPFTWPGQSRFEAAMRALGVTDRDFVVLYSGPNPALSGHGQSWATRAWWIMRSYGVKCAVLNGGWQNWVAEGRAVSTQSCAYPESDFAPWRDGSRGMVTKHDVLAAIDDPATVIVDTLSTESYYGLVDRTYGSFGPRRGHIPSAVNIGFEDVFEATRKRLLPKAQLAQIFADKGLEPGKRIIPYCGGGIGATSVALALTHAGFPDVAIYDGSLWEWCNDPNMPMIDPSAVPED